MVVHFRGAFVFTLIVLNLALHLPFLLVFSIIKMTTISQTISNWGHQLMVETYWSAVRIDILIFKFLVPTKFNIELSEEVESLNDLSGYYLILPNHQSWADIIVLQNIFYKKIPPLKFLVKHELIYVPIVGLICWAFEYPFLNRYTKDQIQKDPSKRGKDSKKIEMACQKFGQHSTSIVNFVEGKRRDKAVKKGVSSSYKYLLNPKSGGLKSIINSMKNDLKGVFIVTIYFGKTTHHFWQLLAGEIKQVDIKLELLPMELFQSAYNQNQLSDFLEKLWLNKDKWMKKMNNRRA